MTFLRTIIGQRSLHIILKRKTAMIRTHQYQEGDRVQVKIPEGWWEEGGEATKFPFARQEGKNLLIEAVIIEFSSSEGEVEDTAKVENVRGEHINIEIEWIQELLDREKDEE